MSGVQGYRVEFSIADYSFFKICIHRAGVVRLIEELDRLGIEYNIRRGLYQYGLGTLSEDERITRDELEERFIG